MTWWKFTNPRSWYTRSAQVYGRRGGEPPKMEVTQKVSHTGMTAVGPAEGPLGPIIWTAAGVRADLRRTKDAPAALYNVTHNGWPDVGTFCLTVDQVGAYMKKHGLTKALLSSSSTTRTCTSRRQRS